ATATEDKETLGGPIAALLFQRFVACTAVDENPVVAAHLRSIEQRQVRGPRAAAYYATLEAVGKLTANHPRFPVKASAYSWFERNPHGVEKETLALVGSGDRADAEN